MNDGDKTKEQLIDELAQMRRRIAELERSEENKTEEELRKSEERYRTVFENTGTATVIIEKDTTISLANAEFERLSGYTKDEIEGTMSWTDTTFKEDLERMLAQHKLRRQYRKHAMRNYEFRFVRRSGEIRHVYIVIDIIPGTEKSVASLTDVTDRKMAEDALRESEERFRNLMEYMPGVSIQGYGTDGVVVYWNQTSEAVYGYSAEEAIGKNLADLIIPKDTRSAFEELLTMGSRVRKSGEYAPPGEFTTVHKDGRTVPVYSSHTAIYLESKEPLLFCLDVDLSEHKRLESQFLQSQKMESIGVLAGGIAHDFNNLLMGIQGYVSLMLGGLTADHPHFQRLRNIEGLIESGSNLTGQLLGFARGGKYEIKPTDLNMLITKSADMFGRTRQEITIHKKLSPDLLPVEVDQGQIEQVLLNLYLNAWQAMPTGGELSLETRNVVFDKAGAHMCPMAPGRYVCATISDTGMGMDAKTKERIFEPFFTTKELGRGTGLGLAMVYGIIKNHNGHIDVISEPGQGTRFVLYFPASEKDITEQKPAVPAIIKGTETILLVDDEPSVLEVSKAILESLGYTVYAVRNGEEAISLYKEKKDTVDLVVLDMIMPGLSGSETFDRIRELNPTARVILSSGYSLNDQAKQIMERGCRGFVQKPFGLTVISQKIREVLET